MIRVFYLHENLVLDFDNRYDTYALIRQSDLVVTGNSQAGLEAAVMGKSVLHGARCFYGGFGFTRQYHDCSDLGLRLDQALADGPLDPIAARIFFHILYNKFCVSKTAKELASLIRRTLRG